MWIYKNFRKIYDINKKKMDFALDEFSYRLISDVNNHNILAIFDGIQDLSEKVKSIVVKCFREIMFIHTDLYLKKYGLLSPSNFREVWDNAMNNLNYFIHKTIQILEKEVQKQYYTTMSSEFISWLFPVKSGKGRFHGRFKTMMYMISISFLNNISKHINKTNGYESILIDISDESQLFSENGVFYSDSDKHVLWNNGVGKNAPSYFGSKQVIIPYK